MKPRTTRRKSGLLAVLSCLLLLLWSPHAPAQDQPAGKLRIFTCGHSFHMWLPGSLQEVEALTDIKGHEQLGISRIGGSRVIQHWNVPDDQNQAKKALEAGTVDVLTLSPMYTPDEGIVNFAKLGLEHNPKIRVTVQEFWLPHDRLSAMGEHFFDKEEKELRVWQNPPQPPPPPNTRGPNPDTSHFNVPTAEQIRKLHEPYFKNMDAYVAAQNKQFGKQVLFVVPVGQAVVALREKIIEGKAPEITKQSQLFTDTLGHPNVVIMTLSAYCHYAVIYHRNPVGLPVPASLAKKHPGKELNRLLQELAWDAVIHHPLSGVTADAAPAPAAAK